MFSYNLTAAYYYIDTFSADYLMFSGGKRNWLHEINEQSFLRSFKNVNFPKYLDRGHSFSRYAKFSENLAFLTPTYQGVKNGSFSEHFAYVLNERSHNTL